MTIPYIRKDLAETKGREFNVVAGEEGEDLFSGRPPEEMSRGKAGETGLPKIRLLLVDDHEAARRGIRLTLSDNSAIEVVAESADGNEAVSKAIELQPDLILLDVSLPGMSGIEAAKLIKSSCPNSKIIIVSQHDSVHFAKEALTTGAMAYVVKSDAGRDLLSAVNAVLNGETFLSRTISKHAQR